MNGPAARLAHPRARTLLASVALGAVLGVMLIHTSAAVVMALAEGGDPAAEVVAAFAPRSAGFLAYHLAVGALFGLAFGLLAERSRAAEARAMERARAAEMRSLHAMRLESIGRLAGGVAHDFNNLLTALGTNLHLARASLPEGSAAREHVAEAMEVTRRAAGLPRQLLAFARRQPTEPKVVAIDGAIEETRRMLERVIGEDVRLDTRLASGANVRVDPGLLEQVLMNLCVNARDAMPRGGRLTIATRGEALDAARAEALDVPAGAYVRIDVHDSGTGMPQEVLDHLFEPFYTTKAEGRGTGLGLSTCYGIARQHGGAISVDSVVGEGSTFTVWVPRTMEPITSAAPPPAPAPSGSGETILVLDDQAVVRDAVARALRPRGYQVLTAASGLDALEQAKAARDVHLLLADVVMPDVDGPTVAGLFRDASPRTRVLFMSGKAGEARGGDGPLLMKPFTPEHLAAAVREALDRGQRGAG